MAVQAPRGIVGKGQPRRAQEQAQAQKKSGPQ